MISQALAQTLLGTSSVTTLAPGGIHPNRANQGEERAHITYNQVSAPVEYLTDGGVSTVRTRFDVKCHAERGPDASHYQSAHRMANAVFAALRTLHNTEIAGLTVYNAEPDTRIDYFDDQIEQHSVLMSVVFHHCQP